MLQTGIEKNPLWIWTTDVSESSSTHYSGKLFLDGNAIWETFGAGRAWKNPDQHSEIGFGGFTSPRPPKFYSQNLCGSHDSRAFISSIRGFNLLAYLTFFFSFFFFIPGASCDDKFNPDWFTVVHSSEQTQLNLASADVLPLLLRAVQYVLATGVFIRATQITI